MRVFKVYSMSAGKHVYIGQTCNLKNRIAVHKSRYNYAEGGYTFAYNVLRDVTTSFDEVEFKVLKEFNARYEALEYEEIMIAKEGNLNTQLR